MSYVAMTTTPLATPTINKTNGKYNNTYMNSQKLYIGTGASEVM